MSGESLMSRHLGSVFAVRRSRVSRSIARVAVAAQVLAAVPVSALTEAAQAAVPAPATRTATVVADASPPSPRVVVNRTAPKVTPPPSAPRFSESPSDLEFRRVRVFAEALVPVGRPTRPDENRALASALMAYVATGNTEAVSSLLQVLLRYPNSPWRPSLMANVATVFSQTGYYSRALRSWDEAWRLTKDARDANGRMVADYALGQWCDLVVRLGQRELLATRMKEIEGREVRWGRLRRRCGSRARACGC